jgi:uncharacterized membrane protein YkvA (DUF1232 family)
MIRLFALWRFGRQDLRLLWFALRHRSRPVWLWPAVAFLGLYALDPANFAIPLLGLVDDFVLLPLDCICFSSSSLRTSAPRLAESRSRFESSLRQISRACLTVGRKGARSVGYKLEID